MNRNNMRHGGKKKKSNKRKQVNREYKVQIPTRTPGIPDTTVVDLKFRTDFVLRGSNPTSIRWITNGAYDADPALGGLKYQYFDVWSQFYSFNKVLSFEVDLTIVNIDIVPLNVTMCHTNSDPGVTGVGYPGYALQPYGFSTTIASYSGGGAKLHYKKRLTPRHVIGDQLSVTSDRYVGSDSANPADNTYFGLALFDQVTSLANGVAGTFICTARIKFFDRKKLDDTVFMKGKPKKGYYTQTTEGIREGQVSSDESPPPHFLPLPVGKKN